MPLSTKPSSKLFSTGIALVGMGRWGCSLQSALVAAGLPPVETISGKHTLPRGSLDAGLIWLCVPDAALVPVAKAIAKKRKSLRGQVMIHSSGVFGGDVLAAARDAGARVGSVHPLMTFPTRNPVSLVNVPFAIECERTLVSRLEKLVLLLRGSPFRITSQGKPLYHAAAVMASPLLVSLASAVHETAMLAGLSPADAVALTEPIMLSTIHNFFRKGPKSSFSGPFARGDAATVSLHLAALVRHPSLRDLYMALAEHAMLALPVQRKRSLRQALAQPAQPILGKDSPKAGRNVGTVRQS